MHIALRPYATTGIALVGAGIIAVAPVTVPPPDLPAVEVAVVDAARTVATDVELTASVIDLLAAIPQYAALLLQTALQPVPLPAELKSLVVELVNAGSPAIAETIKLLTETLPATALSLIAAGKFAHLGVLAVNAVYLGTLTPIAPFAVALMNALPLPFGTTSGVINEFLELTIKTPFLAGTSIMTLLAQVIDDGLSPVAAVTGAIDALSIAVTSAVESVQQILGALGGALPFGALAAPQGLTDARTTSAVAADMPAANDTSAIVSSADSAREDGTDLVTMTVTSAPQEPVADTGADDESLVTANDGGDDGVRINGATDLSDGNMAEPVTDGAADTTDDSAAESGETSGNEAAPVTEPAAGADEGSGADDNASAE